MELLAKKLKLYLIKFRLKEDDFINIAHIIDNAFKNKDNEKELEKLKKEVLDITSKYPLNY